MYVLLVLLWEIKQSEIKISDVCPAGIVMRNKTIKTEQ